VGVRALGRLPQATSLLYGIKPVLIAIVARRSCGWPGGVDGPGRRRHAVGVAALALAGVDEVLLLFAAALGVMLAKNVRGGTGCLAVAPVTRCRRSGSVPQGRSILFGSGYVLLAFLRADWVERLGWISDAQLLERVASASSRRDGLDDGDVHRLLVAGVQGRSSRPSGSSCPRRAGGGVKPADPKLPCVALGRAPLDGANAASLALMAVVTCARARRARRLGRRAPHLRRRPLVFGTRIHSRGSFGGGPRSGSPPAPRLADRSSDRRSPTTA